MGRWASQASERRSRRCWRRKRLRKVLTPSMHSIWQRWPHQWAVDKACPSTAESNAHYFKQTLQTQQAFPLYTTQPPSRWMYTQIKTTSGPFKHQSLCLKGPHMQSLPNNYKSIATSTPRIPQESLSQLSHWCCGKWNTWKCSLLT